MDLREQFEHLVREWPGSEQFWSSLRVDWDRGLYPHPVAIRRGLASGKPVPEWAANFIAAHLYGRDKKLPTGSPPWSTGGLTAGETFDLGLYDTRPMRRDILAYRVRRWKRVYASQRYRREAERMARRQHGRGARPPRIAPYVLAIERVAREIGRSPETVRSYIYRTV
jgi:hypothetical protein